MLLVKGLTCSPFRADTNISVFPVLTSATVLAGLTETLVDVSFTETARVARPAVAGERGQAILTGTIVTRVRIALIDVNFTVLSCVTCLGKKGHYLNTVIDAVKIGEAGRRKPVTFSTFTSVLVRTVGTLSSVFAGGAGTLVNVHLTKIA